MHRQLNLTQRGFTIIEIVVALSLLGLLGSLILPMLATSTENAQRMETDRKLKDLRQTLLSAYRQNAFEIDNEATNQIMVAGVVVLSDGTTAVETTFAWTERYASMSTATLYKDGYGLPLRIFVSNRVAEGFNGTTLYSHKIALVSAGRNGRIDDGTGFDSVSAQLSLRGDDVGEIIDGFQVQRDLFDVTKKRVQKIAEAYQAYFLTRYQSNESRNMNINYFVNAPRAGADAAMFDSTGVIPSTAGTDAVAESTFGSTFGLASIDYKDGYGNPILVDNSSDAVRTPDNATAAMQSAPYTAVVKANLSGGEVFAQALVGSY